MRGHISRYESNPRAYGLEESDEGEYHDDVVYLPRANKQGVAYLKVHINTPPPHSY